MNVSLNFKKSIIRNHNFILFMLFSLCIIIICETNENPKLIKDNFFQINLLLSGESFRLYNNENFIICSYDSTFSTKIFSIQNNMNSIGTEKNFLCFTKTTTDSNLYIINNEETFLYEFNLDSSYSSLLSNSNFNLNLFPYMDNDNNVLKCIITYFILNDNNGYFDIYNFSLEKNTINKILTHKIEDNKFSLFNLGCGISDLSNKNIICGFIYNKYIYSYKFNIESGIKENLNNITIENYLNIHDQTQLQFSSTFKINKNKNFIFSCFKQNVEGVNGTCYFYFMNNNEFIFKDYISKCEKVIINYYFEETKEFIVICKNKNIIHLFRNKTDSYSEQFFKSSEINIEDFDCLSSDNFFLYYNSSKKDYNLIYDCYNNNTYKYIRNITTMQKYHPYYYGQESFLEFTETKSMNEILSNIPDYIKDITSPLFQYYKIISSEYDYSILIRPTNVNGSARFTDIEFSECENFLRFYGNYSDLTLFLIEIYNPKSGALTNKVEYKVFDKKFSEVNLSICENISLLVNYSIKKDISINSTEINYYKNLGINLFNMSDSFFTEFCHVYPDLEFDIIMKDRIDLYLKYSVCEEGCTFEGIDSNYVYCYCKIKYNINTTLPYIQLGEIKKINPIAAEVIKCFWLVFSSDDKINNLGFYIFTFMLGAHIPILCYYLSTGTKPTNDYISREMNKYGYIQKKEKDKIIKIRHKKRKKTKKIININNIKNNSCPPPKNSHENNNNISNSNNNIRKCNTRRSNKKKGITYLDPSIDINNDIKAQRKKRTKKFKTTKGLEDIKYDSSKNSLKNPNKAFTPNLMETQVMVYTNESEEEIKNYDDFIFIKMKVDLEQTEKEEIPKESNKILNNYSYEEALKYDKRSIFRIFYIFLLSKDIVIHFFLLKSPFDSISVLAVILIFITSNDLFFNIVVYTNKNISKRFKTKEDIVPFTLNNNMPYVFCSLFIVYVIIILVRLLFNLSNNIREIFQKEEEKIKKDKSYKVSNERKTEILNEIQLILKLQNKKNFAFFICDFIILLIYWYYVTAFCHVFSNTQTTWVFDTFFSIVFRFAITCLLCFIFSILYKLSLRNKSEKLYKIMMFIYDL